MKLFKEKLNVYSFYNNSLIYFYLIFCSNVIDLYYNYYIFNNNLRNAYRVCVRVINL